MRALCLTVTLLIALAVPVWAWSYLGFEQITVGATAVGFTSSVINASGNHVAATVATCRVRTAEISYTINGTTPTSTVGTLAGVGDVISLSGNDALNNFRAIRTGSSGQADCTVAAP